jgi:hypothetical protein
MHEGLAAIALAAALVSGPALAKNEDGASLIANGFVAVCESPEGPSVSFGWLETLDGRVLQSPENGFKEGRDGFSNTNPVFIFPGGNAETLHSIWSDTRPSTVSKDILNNLAELHAKSEAVIVKNENRITSLQIVGHEVWLSTLIPSLGIAYFTRHKNSTYLSSKGKYLADVSTYFARCRFLPS